MVAFSSWLSFCKRFCCCSLRPLQRNCGRAVFLFMFSKGAEHVIMSCSCRMLDVSGSVTSVATEAVN